MTLANSLGLSVDFLENGAVKDIMAHPIRISMKPATPYSRNGTNIYLRKRSETIEFIPLIGPGSNNLFAITSEAFFARGNWNGIDYSCTLRLSERSYSWEWNIEIVVNSDEETELDLIYLQDVGLKAANSGLINEYYVSQYIERIVFEDERFGHVVCCRQNQKEANGYPRLMIACVDGALSACTDGMQFYGPDYRENAIPRGLTAHKLGGEYAGESSLVAIQRLPFVMRKGSTCQTRFIAKFQHHHPLASSKDDVQMLIHTIEEFNRPLPMPPLTGWVKLKNNIFSSAEFLAADDLNDEELTRYFGQEQRHVERKNGRILSFYASTHNHVVLKEKELLTDRPHGHILQTGNGFLPNEDIVATNPFAYGVFNSHISQGNTNFNVFLSICSNPFNLEPATGQRIFVNIDGQYHLLGVPSAFEMGLNHCRWIYKHGNRTFQVRTWTSKDFPQVNLDFKVIECEATDIIVTHHLDESNGWQITTVGHQGEYMAKPNANSMMAEKFPQARFRIIVHGKGTDARWHPCDESQNLFALHVAQTAHFCMSFVGEVNNTVTPIAIEDPDRQWQCDCQKAVDSWKNQSLDLCIQGNAKNIGILNEIIPWFGHNALVHYLTPFGLEQLSGAAWGTRDVSQGPIDLLLTLGKFAEAREVIKTIFSNQHPDGGWPQWWMFDSYAHVRAPDAHGDIAYWCILALCKYISVTGHMDILQTVLPYYEADGEASPLSEHIERLIARVTDSFIPGTSLVAYGGGDWNDSLQPVSTDMAQRMVSSWTVEICYQSLGQYQKVCQMANDTAMANRLEMLCQRIKEDFNKFLVKDEVVAGYAIFSDDGSVKLMLHPSNSITGVRYSLLPMERGVLSGIFTPVQANHHLQIIEKHLKGPDGARLMDRPLRYKGGIQHIFQRAESSTFFGREIGLMYMHEHIRYAEMLAIMGKTDEFARAIRQIIPIAYSEVVTNSDYRQSNCYYSSSDVVFKTRYDADNLYHEVLKGAKMLRGGWRVYSSGPGIFIGLIIGYLTGIRIENGHVIIDPVMPLSFDGTELHMQFMGYLTRFVYHVGEKGYHPAKIVVNGTPMDLVYQNNPYRPGGASIPCPTLLALLAKGENRIEIFL